MRNARSHLITVNLIKRIGSTGLCFTVASVFQRLKCHSLMQMKPGELQAMRHVLGPTCKGLDRESDQTDQQTTRTAAQHSYVLTL